MSTTPTSATAVGPEQVGQRWWAVTGLVVGLAGLGVAQFLAEFVAVRQTPFVALVEAIRRITPGDAAQATVEFLSALLVPGLLALLALVVALLFVIVGLLWAHARRWSFALMAALAGGVLACGVVVSGASVWQALPAAGAFAVWWGGMRVVTGPLERHLAALERADAAEAAQDEVPEVHLSRRGALLSLGAVAALGVSAGIGSRLLELRRRAVQESRRLLRIPGVTRPEVPSTASMGIDGISSWMTPNDEFHVDGAGLAAAPMEAKEWSLRIHGLVERDLVLTYDDLLRRQMTQAWVTQVSSTNPVGGDHVGNAWWSGIRILDLLDEAGVAIGADTVVLTDAAGTSHALPLTLLRTQRTALLAVAMNGEALPVEQGFPVRSVVAGIHADLPGVRQVVQMRVTRRRSISVGPGGEIADGDVGVRLASRIDLPREGDTFPIGDVTLAGMAWQPAAGIERVQYSLDGTEWLNATIAFPDSDETWVQWAARLRVAPGEHQVQVRAVNRWGQTQSAIERSPSSTGATGWQTVRFTVEEL